MKVSSSLYSTRQSGEADPWTSFWRSDDRSSELISRSDDRSSETVWRSDDRSSETVWGGDDRSSDQHLLPMIDHLKVKTKAWNQKKFENLKI